MQIIHILNPFFYTIFPELKGKSKDELIDYLKAFEIATAGTQGFNPQNKNYRVNLLPGKLFTGYYILANYYVSWVLTMLDAVSVLGIDFGKEYDITKGMVK